MVVTRPDVPALAIGALDWLLGSARVTEVGLAWSETRSDEALDSTLYSGGAGIVVTLIEAYQHFGDDRFGDAAVRAGDNWRLMSSTVSPAHCIWG